MRLCGLLRPSHTGLLRLLFLAPLCLCRLGGLLLLRDGQRRLLPGGLGRRLGGKRVRKAWRKALLFLLHGSSLGTLQCAFVSARKAATFHVWPVAFTYRGAEAVKRQRRCEQWPLQSVKGTTRRSIGVHRKAIMLPEQTTQVHRCSYRIPAASLRRFLGLAAAADGFAVAKRPHSVCEVSGRSPKQT